MVGRTRRDRPSIRAPVNSGLDPGSPQQVVGTGEIPAFAGMTGTGMTETGPGTRPGPDDRDDRGRDDGTRDGYCLKITDRWTTKFTAVATPWATTKPNSWAQFILGMNSASRPRETSHG